jgi:hypothetical protein
MQRQDDAIEIYRRQGFGGDIGAVAPFALLLVDFAVAFIDPQLFGGGTSPWPPGMRSGCLITRGPRVGRSRTRRSLYSDLDEEQQRVYDELVRAGVLPERTADRVTD